MEPKDCIHENFSAQVNVQRFLDTGKFLAEITVTCVACKVAMRFIGPPAGLGWESPHVSIDGTELRAPIEPAIETKLATSASFTMPEIPKRH